jgi:hypothetical protein
VHLLGGLDIYGAAVTTVASGRSAPGHVFLPPKRYSAIAPAPAFRYKRNLIYELHTSIDSFIGPVKSRSNVRNGVLEVLRTLSLV